MTERKQALLSERIHYTDLELTLGIPQIKNYFNQYVFKKTYLLS